MNLGSLDVGAGTTAAGTTQATAQLIIHGLSRVTTVASGAGVILQNRSTDFPGATGAPQVVFNGGANTLKVYPPVGYQINNLTANLPLLLPVNTAVIFWTVSTSQIIGILSA